jgi:amino acid transporter
MKSKNLLKRNLLLILVLTVASILFTACATHSTQPIDDPPGFWSGLLHGFIMMFSFIGSLFTDFKIYSIPNAGGWYDFGFLLGASIFFGGGGSRAGCRW